MKRRVVCVTVLAALVLGGAASPALAKKKDKQAKAAPAKTAPAVPAHPGELRYGELQFEVPQAAKYRHELSSGIPVYVAEDRDLPLVDLSVTVRLGSFLDPADRRGLAELTGSMLRRGGTASMTAEQFDEKADFLAADLSSWTDGAQGGASMNCITPVLDECLDLFFEMLRAPRFQQDRIDVEKDDWLEGMKQRNDSPASISGREWGWLMYGRDHFTVRALTQQDVAGLTREALVEFHRKYWRPELMLVAVSGDVDTRSLLGKLERRFADWKAAGPAVPWPPPAPTHAPAPGVYRVDKDIPQGRVAIGHLGAQRRSWDDPDAYALAVMNDILGGGGFTSRLVKRIRSDEGLAYSAGSGFEVGQWWPGVFRMGYQSKNATVAFAAKIAVEEMTRIREQAVSEEELRIAKASFIDVFPRRFESAADIVDTFVADEYDDRPHAYWDTYRDRIRAVTAADVLRVAKQYLHPERLVFLIVGNWEEIAKGDPEGRATMKEFYGGKAERLPLRDPLTLEPLP